ncbi:MAG: MBL fold metallo-hydrolase [Firmicutes bacterium]|jgi:metallo-beta-lactamase family protein|nr:MBL fold metallo-hydrolase [Bacillota bacterium]NLO65296.1 MBL fold metallo-hydrolase [Bacillota bacterium]
MQLQFLGAAETTSGSSYLLSFDQYQVLIDCGMFHGPEELKQRNYGDFPYSPREIDAVILTHAHIDHSGLLPKLVKRGFHGPIYATGVTADLCRVMLADSGHIQETEVERKNRKLRRQGKPLLAPIYTVEDALNTQGQFRRMVYDEEVTVLPGLRLRMRDAGHILGAAIVELWVTENGETSKFVFSGDLGGLDQPIIQDPTFIAEADYLIIESTYGTRLHEKRDERFTHLAQVVNDTLRRGGNLLIPSFAVGRTQDLLYALRVLQDRGDVPPLTVYVDSPLATAATEVYQSHAQVFDYETRSMLREGRSPFEFPGLHYTESVEESIALNSITGGVIIIAGSGMADAGRIKHHLKHNLWRREAGVLLVGYQAVGTLGRRLQDRAEEVRIHGERIRVWASVDTISGFSAHGDQEALMNWLKRFRHIGRVFVTHGEPEACHGFAELIRKELHVPVTVPKLDEVFVLRGKEVRSTWSADLKEVHVEENFAGVFQAAQGAEAELRASYGYANRRYKIKNTFFTAFNLGSARHFFEEAAALRLIERGAVKPGDLDLDSPELGEKLAELTGKRTWEVVREEVLRPAGLSQTAFYYLDHLPARAASGYTYTSSGAEVENVYAILREGLEPQLFSTAHDLHRFWLVLQAGELLNTENRTLLLERYAKPGGWYEVRGTAPGCRVFLAGKLTGGELAILLSNGEEGAESVYQQLLQLKGAPKWQ